MSVFSTAPSGGIFAKALTDVLGIGAQIASGTGAAADMVIELDIF